MSQELLNTSAPRGLKPGASGFCAVAMTAGMARLLEEQLMSLSGYRWIHPAGHPDAARNPIAFAHWRVMSGGREMSVLSSVRDAGVDYSQRSNRLAHHLVIDPTEQSDAGPAWVLRQPDVVESRWDGELRTWPVGRAIPRGDNPPRPCTAWATAAGDAGWAGVLAEAFLLDPSKPAYLIFAPGAEVLPLIAEAIALLPTALRWRVTFNTYFTDLPAGLICTWRCCAAGTAAANEAPRLATSGVVIDLTKSLGQAPESRSTESARTGRVEAAPSSPSPAMNPRRSMASLANALAEETFNAPMMEATVAANATPPALRTLTPKPENDDRWMPPTRSTIVETASGGGKAGMPRGGKSRFKVFAILWPVIAMGGILGWHFRGESRGKAELHKELALAKTKVEEQGKEIENFNDSAKNKIVTEDQRVNRDDSKTDAIFALQKTGHDKDTSIGKLEEERKAANIRIASLEADVKKLAPATQAVIKLTADLDEKKKYIEDADKKLAGVNGQGVAESTFGLNVEEILLLTLPKDSKADSLILDPADLPGEFGATVGTLPKEIVVTGRVVTEGKTDTPGAPAPADKSVVAPTAAIRLRGRRVAIQFSQAPSKEILALKRWLSLATVHVKFGDKEVGRITLRQPSEGVFFPNDEPSGATALACANLPNWKGMEFGPPIELPVGWHSNFPSDTDHSILLLTNTANETLKVEFKAASGDVSTNWRERFKKATADSKEAQKIDIGALQIQIKQIEDQIAGKTTEKKNATDKGSKDAFQKEIDTQNADVAEKRKAAAAAEKNLAAAAAALSAMNQVIAIGDSDTSTIKIPIVYTKTGETIHILKLQGKPVDKKAK